MFKRRYPSSILNDAVRVVCDELEGRVLFAANVGDIADVKFRGVTAPAVVGQYNISVRNGTDVSALASRTGFTGVVSLGGNYYSITTDWASRKVDHWARSANAVQTIAPNYVIRPNAVPNDPLYADNQYYLNNTGQVTPNPTTVPLGFPQVGIAGADIDAQKAWDITTGSSDVIVAVLDTGLDITHPDIAGNVWSNPGESGLDAEGRNKASNGLDDDGNGVTDDINGYDFYHDRKSLTDFGAHGTWVSGVIAASGNNGTGTTGVTWNTKIMMLKVFGDEPVSEGFTYSSIEIKAINYVIDMKRKGTNIAAINASLGGPNAIYDRTLARSINAVTSLGVVYVAAAGNEAANIDKTFVDPARQVFVNGSLVVAATDNQDHLASFSNFGATTVQVAAPGVQVFTTHSKDGLGRDKDTNAIIPLPAAYTDPINQAKYDSVDGTSFSAPIVAGIVALARAANPNATAAQIVDAVKRGADPLASLAGATANAPKLVSTGGRVNAYNTLRILQNELVGTNTVTSGNFIGAFGATGMFIYGGTTGSPTFPFATGSLTPTGSAPVEVKLKAKDTRSLQIPGGSTRSTTYLRSDDSISIPFDFTTTQRLTVYTADLEKEKLAESIQLIDTDTGMVLQTVTLTDFKNGTYSTFDATGRVTLKISGINGKGAVLNGLFLDPTPTHQQVAAATVDTLTGGDWLNVYGDQGIVLPGNTTQGPTFATTSTTATTASAPTRNKLAPETPLSSKVRSEGVFTADSTFDYTINITDGSTRRVTFYTYNTAKTPRLQRYALLDASGTTVALQDVTVAKSGVYVTFEITGTETVRVTGLSGGAPSVAGVFFTGQPGIASTSGNTADFAGSNVTAGGDYRPFFGANGAYVVGASTFYPYFVTQQGPVPVGPSFTTVLESNTKKKNALKNPNTLVGNIIGYIGTQSTTSLPLTLTEPGHRVSAYFVDFDKKKRVEKVEMVDNATGTVLSSQLLRDFEKGKYLSWDVTGDVSLRITRVAGPSAVVSGIFFD